MKKFTIALFVLTVSLLFVSCSDDNSATNVVGKLKLNSFTPLSGRVGTQVIITGEGFSENISENQISFGTTRAVADSVKNNKIYVRVPNHALSGKITVIVGNETYTSDKDFAFVPEGTDNLMPTAQGSYWVYEKYALNKNNSRTDAPPTLDSNVINGAKDFLTRRAAIQSRYSKVNGVYKKIDEQCIYNNNDEVYVNAAWFNDLYKVDESLYGIPFNMGEDLLEFLQPQNRGCLVANNFVKPWQTASTGDYWGSLRLIGSNSYYENLPGFGPALKFTYSFSFEGEVKVFDGSSSIKFYRDMHVWFVNNLGVVKVILESANYTIPNLVETVLPGYEMTLLRSSVK